jgi:Multicopper oxidase
MLSTGQRVEIDLVNRSMMAHPIHLHGNAFQVIAIRMNEMIPRKPASVLNRSRYRRWDRRPSPTGNRLHQKAIPAPCDLRYKTGIYARQNRDCLIPGSRTAGRRLFIAPKRDDECEPLHTIKRQKKPELDCGHASSAADDRLLVLRGTLSCVAI